MENAGVESWCLQSALAVLHIDSIDIQYLHIQEEHVSLISQMLHL